MNKSIVIGTITLLTMGSSSVFASEVGDLNTFQSGTPAVAAEVNENFEEIKSAVNDNDAAITDLETRVTNSEASTAANTAAIATKADAADVAANTAAIATNTAAIGANTLAIGTKANSADVAANTADIATNTADIATNTADIATNTDDIATNTADIATNAGDIATNAANISANSSDIADLLAGINGTTCLGNDSNDIMVRVGPLCVDKYEASVWSTSTGTVGVPYGTASDNYPDSDPANSNIGCNDNGNGCSGAAAVTAGDAIYARSQIGVAPSRYITWFQAQQACANSGKRLLTNAEWQMAVAGTPDNSTDCTTTGGIVGATNATPNCVSNWGVVNMIGNASEWVADWIQGNGDNSNWAPAVSPNNTTNGTYNNDSMSGIHPASNQGSGSRMIAALFRGGDAGDGTDAGAFKIQANAAPSFSANALGFRCAR
jgi:hypothetical protein